MLFSNRYSLIWYCQFESVASVVRTTSMHAETAFLMTNTRPKHTDGERWASINTPLPSPTSGTKMCAGTPGCAAPLHFTPLSYSSLAAPRINAFSPTNCLFVHTSSCSSSFSLLPWQLNSSPHHWSKENSVAVLCETKNGWGETCCWNWEIFRAKQPTVLTL